METAVVITSPVATPTDPHHNSTDAVLAAPQLTHAELDNGDAKRNEIAVFQVETLWKSICSAVTYQEDSREPRDATSLAGRQV
jgi:hypothetical protein